MPMKIVNTGKRDKFTAQKSFYIKIILNKHSFILFAYSLMIRQMSFQTRKRAIQQIGGVVYA